MRTPIPEPYDITEIPYIAWVPGTSAWLIAAVGICGLALLAWRRNTPQGPRGDIKIIDKMLSELRHAVEPAGSINLERASRIARRIVSHISGRNVAELTGDELRAAAEEERSTRLGDIMRTVASFEEIGYSPPSSDRDVSARTVGARLASLITDYRNELRAP